MKEPKKVICILIADFKISNLTQIDKFYTRWKIMEENYTKQSFTDKLYIVIIELEKLKDIKETDNEELLSWCKFIKNPEEMEGEEMKNKYIRKAKEKLDEINQNEEERRLAEIRERTIRDEMAIRDSGYIDGMKDGEKKGILKIAKILLSKKMELKDIMEITQLSKKEIENIT